MMTHRRSYRVSVQRLLRTWIINLLNGATLVVTLGARVRHEGAYYRRHWFDWAREFRCRPATFATPSTEEEICRVVRDAGSVRVVGAGHSFNSGPLTNGTMMSLDRYAKIDVVPHPQRPDWGVARVQAGARLRDVTRVLSEHGYSLSVAGSTDAQSIGGLIATDVHGTGRDHGFLSEALLSLRVVDAAGVARTVRRGDDLFHAAIGGAGTCGVVVEAEIECEPAYSVAKAIKLVSREWAEAHIEELLKENSHLSFYYFGGFARSTDQEDRQHLSYVRMNKWNRTVDPPNALLRLHKVLEELLDLVFSGFVFDFARLAHVTAPLGRLFFAIYGFCTNQRQLVYPAHRGFPRTLYFRHDEIEYGVRYERYRDCLREVRALLIQRRFPTIIEVRFTDDTSQSLLGPGAGGRTAYIELAPSMSRPTDPIFEEFEAILRRYDARPHLGKKIYYPQGYLEQVHGRDKLQRFHAARIQQDPNGKFWNDFCQRYLAPAGGGQPDE